MKKFVKLTLATNQKTVVIDRDSIVFATEQEENGLEYTRVQLKQCAASDEIKWIDVLEKAEKIM